MVTDTNAEQVLAGEASSSHLKRQRLSSLVEEEAEGGENVGEVTGDEVTTTEVRSGMLLDLDLLDCPVCCHALTNPIFQCDNGHIACSACCINMRNKCPSCTLPIGIHRCRIMERVVEAIMVPCPNAKRGCTDKFSYGKELAHEKECSFALCDIWCFIHLVYMLLNWFSSLYRVFLVLLESLQVWSCIGWEMDQLEQKRQKTMQFGGFHAEQS